MDACIVRCGRGYKEISLRWREILAAITVFLAILAASRLILLYPSSYTLPDTSSTTGRFSFAVSFN